MRTIVISALIILAISTTGYMIGSNTSLQKALLQNLQMSNPQLRGEACLKVLEEKKVSFSPLGNMKDKKPRRIENTVRIEGFSTTELSGPLILSCIQALAVHVAHKMSAADVLEALYPLLSHMGSHTICVLIRGLSSQLKCFKVAYHGRFKTNSYLHQFAMEKWL